MLDNTTLAKNTTAALAGVTVSYFVDEVEARQRLSDMVRAGGPVAIDIETAPHVAEVEKLAGLIRTKEIASGKLRALRKLKAPAPEIAALVAEEKQLAAAIKYAKSAGLDPRRARIRLLQVYDGGDRVLVIDLDRASVLDLLEGVSVIAHNMAFEMAFLETAGIALGAVHCTLQACRLLLGEHATSLADGAEAFLDLTARQDGAEERLERPASDQATNRIRRDRRCRRLANRRARSCPTSMCSEPRTRFRCAPFPRLCGWSSAAFG